MIQSDTKGNETVRKVRDPVCLKQKPRQVVHKGTVKPEAGAHMESQQRVIL